MAVGPAKRPPGQWTDDTSQAVAIAEALAEGLDPRTEAGLDFIAGRFLDWYATDAVDVGRQTAAVFDLASLNRTGSAVTGADLTAAARSFHERTGRSAGNGSLMRTGPLALAFLDDPAGLAEAAMRVSALTHYDWYAQEACAVWSLLIRHCVLTAQIPKFSDIAQWSPRPEFWAKTLQTAQDSPASDFTENAWAVGCLQAAWSAIHATGNTCGEDHLVASLTEVIRIGNDTDTTAAVVGALVGGVWGAGAVPLTWRDAISGWPGYTAADLFDLAEAIAARTAAI